MRSDPKWITAKWAGRCSQCGEPFAKGADVFWYPIGRDVLSGDCADGAGRDFSSHAFDDRQVGAY